MATVNPYYTSLLEYPALQREVYHDKNTCPDGKTIKPEHLNSGTAGKPLCQKCRGVS